MATTFEGSPAVDEILRGATVVATGVLKEVIDREEDEGGRVLTIHRTEVTEVLSGHLVDREILIRTVGDAEAWKSDEEHILVLSLDFGRGNASQYVPYFSQPSPIHDGRCTIENGEIGLQEIRERLAKIEQRQALRTATLIEEEAGQDLSARYPEISEIGIGRGDVVIDAQLAEPRAAEKGDDYEQSQGID